MKFPRTVRRFLIGYLILHMLAAAIFVIVLSRITRNQMITAAKSKMSAMTLVLAEHVEDLGDGFENPQLPAHVKRVGDKSKMRVTLIKSDGSVVADSVTADRDIGPHATRTPSIMLDRTASMRWLFAICLGALTALLMSIFSAKFMQPLAFFTGAAQKIGVGDYQASASLARRTDEKQPTHGSGSIEHDRGRDRDPTQWTSHAGQRSRLRDALVDATRDYQKKTV